MRSIVVQWLSPFLGDAAALLVPGWFACIGLAWLLVSLLTLRAAARRGDDVAALAGVLAIVYTAALAGGIALPALVSAAGALWSGHGLRLRWSGMVSYAGHACGAVALVLALRGARCVRRGRPISSPRPSGSGCASAGSGASWPAATTARSRRCRGR